jgi:hypothetical protein
MRSRATSWFVRAHRIAIVLAAASLGVGASLVTTDEPLVGGLMMLIGAGGLTVAADAAGTAEEQFRLQFAADPMTEPLAARSEAFQALPPRRKGTLALVSLGLVVAGLVVTALADEKSQRRLPTTPSIDLDVFSSSAGATISATARTQCRACVMRLVVDAGGASSTNRTAQRGPDDGLTSRVTLKRAAVRHACMRRNAQASIQVTLDGPQGTTQVFRARTDISRATCRRARAG